MIDQLSAWGPRLRSRCELRRG